MMSYLVTAFGVLILILGAIVLVKQEAIFRILRSRSESLTLHALAVVVRLLLGMVLIIYASDSRYPIVLDILGWVSLIVAVVLVVIGRSNFKNLMKWVLNIRVMNGGLGGLLGILFGGFLIYAAS